MRTRRIIGLVALFIAACGGDDDAVTPRRDAGTDGGGKGGTAGKGGSGGASGTSGTSGTAGKGGTSGTSGGGGTVGVDGGDGGDAYVGDAAAANVDASYMDGRAGD